VWVASCVLFTLVGVLTLCRVEILQRSYDMENSPASERATADRSDDVRGDSLRDDIRLDGERKHQRLREGAPG